MLKLNTLKHIKQRFEKGGLTPDGVVSELLINGLVDFGDLAGNYEIHSGQDLAENFCNQAGDGPDYIYNMHYIANNLLAIKSYDSLYYLDEYMYVQPLDDDLIADVLDDLADELAE